jgi:hypothetical protein
MLTETLETLCYIMPTTFNEFGDNGFGIVKPDFSANSTDVLKYGNHTFQKALHVFIVIELEKAIITEGETEHKIFGFVMKHAISIKNGCPKIGLSFLGIIRKRNVAIDSF